MSKHAKRIKKINKSPKNALVMGSAFGHLKEYIDAFLTVFVYTKDETRIRDKRVVYRNTLDSLTQIADIDIVFVDREYFEDIRNIFSVWRKSSPVILTQGTTFTEKALQKFLNSEHYYAVEVTKEYMIWKTK
jgi:vacuolar-type H+-ATPase subunit F/Vma7